MQVEVDTITLDVLPGDKFLLASDGLCGYLDDTQAQIPPMVDGGDHDALVKSLMEFANAKGGKDNITAVLMALAGSSKNSAHAE